MVVGTAGAVERVRVGSQPPEVNDQRVEIVEVERIRILAASSGAAGRLEQIRQSPACARLIDRGDATHPDILCPCISGCVECVIARSSATDGLLPLMGVNYVDLHSHLLPGLDDGAATMEETRRFARRLDAEGVRDVACTPHVKRAHFPRIDLARAGRAAAPRRSGCIDAEGLSVRLHPGGELADEDALELSERELALIAQGPEHAPWLLLECPFAGIDHVFDAAVARLTGLGYGLLLAHPERARGPLDRLDPHLEAGALLQVNVSSLLGEHGPRAREIAARLVRHGLVYCLASDSHPGTRESTLPLGYRALVRAGMSEIQAQRLTQSNPRFLLREGNPHLALPLPSADRLRSTKVGSTSCGRGTGGPGSPGDRRRAEPQPGPAGPDRRRRTASAGVQHPVR